MLNRFTTEMCFTDVKSTSKTLKNEEIGSFDDADLHVDKLQLHVTVLHDLAETFTREIINVFDQLLTFWY